MIRVMLLSLAICLSSTVHADALGAADAAEIAKLTEIITQMTELLAKTQEYLDVQQRLTDMQERTFFRKAQAYGREIRHLVHEQERLEQQAHELREDPLHTTDMLQDIEVMRQQAQQIGGEGTKQTLLELADLLQTMGNTQWLRGTARSALAETTGSTTANTQDQLLAGIFYSLVELQRTVGMGEAATTMKEMDAKWMMQGSYSVFNRNDED